MKFKERHVNIYNSYSFLFFVIFQALDCIMTIYAIHVVGGFYESNPVANFLTQGGEIQGLISLKIFGIIYMMVMYLLIENKLFFSWFISFANGMYYPVLYNNIIKLWF